MEAIKRALVSVTDKRCLDQLARLVDAGWEIISTGGTAKKLGELGISCVPVEKVTDFPEMLGGRVKTLHPRIFAGILARRDVLSDMQALAEHGIVPIDLVCVNLYDFKARPSIEEIDIGGPSLLRAAAKNGYWVTPIIDPDDYQTVFDQIVTTGIVPESMKEMLVRKVFHYTAEYERMISEWIAQQDRERNPFLTPPKSDSGH